MDEAVRLSFWTERSIGKVEHLAIVLEEHGRGRHIALVYVDDDLPDERVPRWLHLAWHHDVATWELKENYAWCEVALEPERRRILGRLCRKVSMRYGDQPYPSIGYALRYAGGLFDEESGYFLCVGGVGLTCATFVMAIFETRGWPLLRTDNWPQRPDDLVWQQQVIGSLMRHRGDPGIREHIAILEKDLGCVRFRPEEVAAAGLVRELPLDFQVAEPRGREIATWLSQRMAGPNAGPAPGPPPSGTGGGQPDAL